MANTQKSTKSTKRKDYLREYHRVKVTAQRLGEREIGEIPAIKNPRRRRKGLRDPEYYCQVYFPVLFENPFSDDQKEIMKTLLTGIRSGGWLAVAAERGGGKSTITKGITTYAINYGLLRFVLLVHANQSDSSDALEDIRGMYESSPILEEDFPEICYPISQLEGAAQRANMQTCQGVRTRMKWGKDIIQMPDIVGSKAAQSLIMARGIDGAIRGKIRRGVRPDLVILDDVETRESVYSETETCRRRETIEQDIIGLAGPNKNIAIVMLGTIMRRNCLIDEFTTQSRKPAWHGVRQKLLINKPEREDLWEKYIEVRRTAQIAGDKMGVAAHNYYLENRVDMDGGAVVSNIYRYDKRIESSALEACYNKIADMELFNFLCEYQNEPPEESSEGTGVEYSMVCKKINHLERGVVPNWCERLTCGIDVGGRLLHWCVVAWKQGLEGYVIDYGTEPVNSPYVGSLTSDENKQAVEAAILSALNDFWAWERETGWIMSGTAEKRHIDLGLVDSGWLPDPVYAFCQKTQGVFRPSKGLGSAAKQGKYRQPSSVGDKKIGLHWFAHKVPRFGWLYNLDSDYWKNSVHSGFMTPENLPGSLSLFGNEPIRHRLFADQICAEIWVREFQPGKGWREGFTVRHRNNHFLDTMAGNIAAASMSGIRLILPEKLPAPKKAVQEEGKPKEMYGQRRAGPAMVSKIRTRY